MPTRQKRSVTFSDALKTTRATAFSAMVKPVGSACNLRCAYCYYLDKELLHSKGVMSEELLEQFVQQYIGGNQVPEVTFCWHGGEPLLAGIDFYKKAIEYQEQYRGDKKIVNTLQTNGTKVTDEWAQFFAANEFLIGVSIDGPEAVHNATRGNSFGAAMRGVEALQRAGAQFNTLSAVSRHSVGRGAEIYHFLKSIGSKYHQYLPVAEFLDTQGRISHQGTAADFSISGADWGQFMVDIFDRWVVADVGQVFVQLFDSTLAGTCGVPAGVCSMNESCGDALVVEYTGEVYSCDHFVYPEYALGNIGQQSLASMFRSGRQFRFGANKHTGLSNKCTRCKWLHLCHGECPKHRDAAGLSLLCAGYERFFSHSAPYFVRMRDLLEQGLPPALVMGYARQKMGL